MILFRLYDFRLISCYRTDFDVVIIEYGWVNSNRLMVRWELGY